MRYQDYFQPPAGNTEKYISLRPDKVAGLAKSCYQGLSQYLIRDFGCGLDAAQKILRHIVLKKFQSKYVQKCDFWYSAIIVPVSCTLYDRKTRRLFSELKPQSIEQIDEQFAVSEKERLHDIEKYVRQIHSGTCLGAPLYITGRLLNSLMENPKADENGIYMLDGARRICARALSHADSIEILLIMHEDEHGELIDPIISNDLKKRIHNLKWFNNYQDIPMVGLKGERSNNRFELMDMTVLQDATVMDFGCNLGQACIKASLAGAKYVVGIEGVRDTFLLAEEIRDQCKMKNINYLNVDFNDPKFDNIIDNAVKDQVDYSFFFSVYRTKELVQRDRLFHYIINKSRKGIFFEGHAHSKIDTVEYYDWLFESFGLKYHFMGFSEGHLRPLFFLPLREKIGAAKDQTNPTVVRIQENSDRIDNKSDDPYLVSAIISTYKSERFIEGKINDLLNQSIADSIEIIVVDSNSPENEGAICREYMKKHKNIKYIRTKTRETVYKAWNLGIQESKGKYITNSNTDDRLRKDAFKVMAAYLDENPDVDLVYGDFYITNYENMTFDRHIRTGYSIKPDYSADIMLHGCHMGPQPLWRRSVHDKIGYFNESLEAAGDYEFWCRMAASGFRLAHLNDFLGLYLHNPEGIINRNQSLASKESATIRSFYQNRLPEAAKGLPSGYYYPGRVEYGRYVNITMVTYNRLDFTRAAIQSILRFTRFPYVLTVIDNNSTDGSRVYLEALKEKGVITNLVFLNENIGVAKAANIGWLLETEAEYYLKYDNDIVIQEPDWLCDLIEVVDRIPEAGAVAYNFEVHSYPVQVINGMHVRPKVRGNLGGACICIPKRTINRLGYWSEDYGLYSEEDADYGYRIKLAGLMNIYMENENIGVHLPAGKAAVIDSCMTARDGIEEKVHAEYRAFKDQQRRKNVLTNKFHQNIQKYQTGEVSLYKGAHFAQTWLKNNNRTSDQTFPLRLRTKSPDRNWHSIPKPLRMSSKTSDKSAPIKIAVLSYDDQYAACSHLRIVAPMSHSKRHVFRWCVRTDGRNATIDLNAIDSADAVVVQRGFPAAQSRPYLDAVLESGKPIIFEVDDLLTDLPSANPHYSIVEKQKPYLLEMMKRATAMTVATEQLKKHLSIYNSNIYVLPNLIDERDWHLSLKAASPPLTIGYAGTATHSADLGIIEKAIMDIMNIYGDQVRLVTFGCTTQNLSQLPNHEVIAFEPRYDDYIQKLQALKIDIALAPLLKNAFNQCKSNIKWLEYSAAGIAGVYSDILPYNRCIQNGKTGLLADDSTSSWFNAIRRLIEDTRIRAQIVHQANQHVLSNYSIKKNVHQWIDAYCRILAQFQGDRKVTPNYCVAN